MLERCCITPCRHIAADAYAADDDAYFHDSHESHCIADVFAVDFMLPDTLQLVDARHFRLLPLL